MPQILSPTGPAAVVDEIAAGALNVWIRRPRKETSRTPAPCLLAHHHGHPGGNPVKYCFPFSPRHPHHLCDFELVWSLTCVTHLARTFLSRHSQLSQGQEARRWPACFKHVTHHEPNKEKLSQEFKLCFCLTSYFSFSSISNVFAVVVIMIFTTTINVVVTSSHLLLPMGKILVTERRVLVADRFNAMSVSEWVTRSPTRAELCLVGTAKRNR